MRCRCLTAMGLGVLLLAMVPGPGRAADDVVGLDEFDDFSSLDLEALLNTEIETGSGFKQKLSDVPAVVEVMTRERIEALGVRDLYELMLRLTGVRIDASGLYPLMINTPEVRGGSVSDRILLVVDDHPQLDELDEMYHGFAIPIESIERVEFLRGPAAVLYGSSSMAGVLRVVTRKPEKSGGGGSVIYDPLGHGGELSGHGTHLFGEGDNTWALRSDVQLRRNEAWGNRIEQDVFGAAGESDNQVQYFSHLSTIRNEDWYFRAQNHIIQGRLLGLIPSVLFEPKRSELHLHGGELGRAWQVRDWTIKARVAGETRRRRIHIGYFPPPGFNVFPDRTTEETRTQLQFDGYSSEYALTAAYSDTKYSLLSGLQYRFFGLYNVQFLFPSDGVRNSLFPTDEIKANVHDINLYLQGSYSPVEKLTLLVGGRMNVYKTATKNANFLAPEDRSPDAIVSPMGRAAIVWRPIPEMTVKALYGRSFRLPTLLELYTSIFGFVTPNTNLKPEDMDTVELAFDMRPIESLFWRVNGFYNRDRDTIESVDNPDPGAAGTRFRNNPDGFYTYGIETQMDWHATVWMNLFGSFVFGEGYNYGRDAAGDRIEIYERDVPRVVGNGGITFKPLKTSQLRLTPFVYHRGHSDDASPDTLLNFTARYAPNDWLDFSLHVNNLTGREFYQPYFVDAASPPVEGRAVDTTTLRLGVHATF